MELSTEGAYSELFLFREQYDWQKQKWFESRSRIQLCFGSFKQACKTIL